MRLLVVEDEPELADAVARGLRRDGYAVDVAHDGQEALDRLAINAYDLVCLDLNLPVVDGLEVCRRLRSDPYLQPANGEPSPRVLILTARDKLGDRVAGLDEGADDYLVKPFAFEELLARVRTLLRRDSGRTGALLTVGDLTLDTARFEAARAGRPVDLTAKEFALLELLLRRRDEVLPRSLIASQIWDMNFDSDTNVIEVAVRRLRAKIDDGFEPKLIQTVRGMGYVLETPEPG